MFFLYPFVLLLLVVPFFFFIYRFKTKKYHFEKHFSAAMLKKLSLGSSSLHTTLKYALFLLVLVFFIIALARPVKLRTYLDTSLSKPSVIIAIDASKSMQNTDIYPHRFTLAKTKLTHLVAQAQDFSIGILFYAKEAYVLYPLSQNPQVLSFLLKDMNLTQTFAPNSNLFAALQGANSLLKKQKNKHIILLSDGGEETSRASELSYLKSKHIHLWALAITTKPNHALSSLCVQSQGAYQHYTWGDEDITTLLNAIKHTSLDAQMYHYDMPQYKEYFSYPLLFALFLLLLLFFPLKKPKQTALVWIFMFCVVKITPLSAGMFDFWYLYHASQSYKKHDYKEAIYAYKKTNLSSTTYYNLATALYKSSQYMDAINYYKKALGQQKEMNAKIYYNIATAYVRKNKLDLAKMYYKKSLKSYPYKVAKENLDYINAHLKIQRKNLHKKYKKLHFKPIAQNSYAQNNVFSSYSVKINHLIPDEEARWFQKIMKHTSPVYVQKISTTKRSKDADKPW